MRLATALAGLKDLAVIQIVNGSDIAIGRAIEGPATLDELESQLRAGTTRIGG